jgi:methyl-accepting chemotaxis protein
MAIALPLIAVATNRMAPASATARVTEGVALMASISLLVGVLSGQKLQVDMHMYYFAGLALLVTSCDWRVIVGGAAMVAVHHILLNFVMSSLVYPGGPDLLRLGLHALVLIFEAVSLIWMASTLEATFNGLAATAEQARVAQKTAEESRVAALHAEQAAAFERERRDAEREAEATVRLKVVEDLAAGLTRLSRSDLTTRLTRTFTPEYETLRADFNEAASKLEGAFARIAGGISAMNSGAADISRASDDLARRTEHQAASLEETAAALDEITATVGRTAEGASHASRVVTAAKQQGERSSKVVGDAIAAMQAIESSSDQIGSIIGVIDEIAFQTNLLALNAGVEAARAGDAGKGFAVVAQEVRALAQRSANAAKEIKGLISKSSDQVTTGVTLVGQAGDALNRILTQIADMSDVVADIASSAREQATALNQVNGAVNDMDKITQQNAAMVEQSTAASHGVSQEANGLATLISDFKIGLDGQHPGRGAPSVGAAGLRRAS